MKILYSDKHILFVSLWIFCITVATAVQSESNPLPLFNSVNSTILSTTSISSTLAGLTIPFEENHGQFDPKVGFQARTLAGSLFVTQAGELVWNLEAPLTKESLVKTAYTSKSLKKIDHPSEFIGPPEPAYSLVERFIDGKPEPIGANAFPTQVNYFHGNDPQQWKHEINTWEKINLGEVWKGIEVSLSARSKNVEKIFTIAPGVNANSIALEVAGGNLIFEKEGGLRVENGKEGKTLVTFTAPVAWQDIKGEKKSVQVAYRMIGEDAHRYGFSLGAYDPTYPVLIDPLIQSTYLGGNSDDSVAALVVTTDAVYVAGSTASTNFPGISGGAQAIIGRESDIVVAKLSRDLKTLIQTTYLGGNTINNGTTFGTALAASTDAIYVAGYTDVSNFPGTQGGAQPMNASNGSTYIWDSCVAKLSLDLKSLIQATYLGGSHSDQATALSVKNDSIYIAGTTDSNNFPGTVGGLQEVNGGNADTFVAQLSTDLKILKQATYLGGNENDYATALTVADSIYVTGLTFSKNFPAINGGAQMILGGADDGFIAQLSLDLKTLVQSTYLGGDSYDQPNAIAATEHSIYVAGTTMSQDFPGTAGGVQTPLGGEDAFLAKLSLDLKTLDQATFLGGSGSDNAFALGITDNAVYVAGATNSADFPGTHEGIQAALSASDTNSNRTDAFIARLSLNLKTLIQSTYLGGNSNDQINALAVTGNIIYVAGDTESKNFPGTEKGVQSVLGNPDAGRDMFITQLSSNLYYFNSNATVGDCSTSWACYNVLTIIKEGTGNGTVTSITPANDIDCGGTCSHLYSTQEFTMVVLYATADSGSTFIGWSGDTCSGTNKCTVSMNSDKTVTATFNKTATENYLLGIHKAGTGSGIVTSSTSSISCDLTCNAAYSYEKKGSQVSLTAAPASGSTFTGWSGACSGTGTCTVTMSTDKTVTANFTVTVVSYPLNILKSGTGSGLVASNPAGIYCGTDCTESYQQGSQVSLTATPASGSTFAGWSGACSGTDTCTVIMSADKTVTATFNTAPVYYSLTVNKPANGTVTSQSGKITLSGQVTLGSLPVCARVLANGVGGYSCDGSGHYNLADVSLDSNEQITLFVWADGMKQSKFILSPTTVSPVQNINMNSSPCNGTGGTLSGGSASIQQVNLSGTAYLTGTNTPICAAVLANGVAGFSCNNGFYSLANVPVDSQDKITLFAWADGFLPYKLIFTPSASTEMHNIDMASESGCGHASIKTLTEERVQATQVGRNTGEIACGTNCTTSYLLGTQVILNATPDSGYAFQNWAGDCSGTSATCVLSMSSNKNVTAAFNAVTTYPLHVQKAGTGSGTVISSQAGIYCGSDCDETYQQGYQVTLTATPDTNSIFAGWSGVCSGTNPCTLTMDAAKSVTATFNTKALNFYLLTIQKSGTGSGIVTSSPAGIYCGASCSVSYPKGYELTLTAAPDSNSTFAGWSGGGCSGTSTSCSITVNSDQTVTALFNQNSVPQYMLTITLVSYGTVSSQPAGINCSPNGSACSKSYAQNTQVTLSASPNNGYSFEKWSGDCSGMGTCTVNMTSAKAVTATFKLDGGGGKD